MIKTAAGAVKAIVVRAARAWNDFWFAPANPTTLGVIRILAGALVLYAHLAYSYDLLAFFGKDAWLSNAQANWLRKTTPHPPPPSSWEPVRATIILPPDR